MPEETDHRRTNRYVVGGTILGVLCLLVGLIWWKLPTIACYGMKYEWSREYSISTLKWIGPRAAGAIWKYEDNFNGYDHELWIYITKNVVTKHDVARFIHSFEDINAKTSYGITPLHVAPTWNHLDIAKLLIENGANVNAKASDGETPLHWAASGGNLDIAKLLVENGADVNAKNSDGETPLHWAAISNDNPDIARLLIECGADVNAKDSDWETPLHRAALTGNLDIAKILIENGADVNVKDAEGKTPLSQAIRKRNLDIVKLLVENGADVNAKNSDGETPLHWAAESGHPDIVKLLIEKGLDVNAKASNGETPLHCTLHTLGLYESFLKEHDKDMDGFLAARTKSTHDIAKLLVENGADVNAKASNGATPLDWTRNPDIKTLLRKHGAKTSEELQEQNP